MFHILLGQNWDINWHKGVTKPTEAQYYQMVVNKTSVLPRINARMLGATLGLKRGQVNGMVQYVEALGAAFQIQDDILAITSEEYKKERGSAEDIREGKRSLMVTRIISKDTPKARKLLEILNAHTDDEKQIDKALKIISAGKNIDYATKKSRKLMEVAWKKA